MKNASARSLNKVLYAGCAAAALLIGQEGNVYAGSGILSVTQGSGTAIGAVTDATGTVYISKTTIWDYSAAANGAGVDASHNLQTGEQYGPAYPNHANFYTGQNHAVGTGTFTLIPAQSAKLYVPGLQCGRTDAGTLAMTVALNDTSTLTLIIPNLGGGGGNNAVFSPPLVLASATALIVTPSASLTGGTLTCNAQAYNAN